MDPIIKIAEKHNLSIIEDAAQTMGAYYNGRHGGTFGKVAAFSAHPLKNLNALGDGGFLVTSDDDINESARRYRNHGMIDRDNIDIWGVNMRLQPLQAIVANEGLKKISKVISKRNLNAKKLDFALSKLSPLIKIPRRINGHIETYTLYMIQCENRNELKDYLIKNNIEVKIHYPIPLHLQKPSLLMGYKKGDFPEAEGQALKLITLPVHQYLNNDQIDYMIKKIFDFYA